MQTPASPLTYPPAFSTSGAKINLFGFAEHVIRPTGLGRCRSLFYLLQFPMLAVERLSDLRGNNAAGASTCLRMDALFIYGN
jgi:hypothetical protein